ncbi:MAG: hypothetical protein IJU53_03910 [Thermoguttaceae bacterium]|jgi:hypothetical protein|nr:hypothetical protein [Thermoguttaceae bacterium]
MFHCKYIGQCPDWPRDCEKCQVLLEARAKEEHLHRDDDAQDAQPSDVDADGEIPRVDVRE